MILNKGSLMFNLNTPEGGTPAWGTEMGQNKSYYFDFEDYESLITSMVYMSVDDIKKVRCPLGKGGSRQDDYEYVLAAKYDKVYVNDVLVNGAEFLLLIVKQIASASNAHIGRRSLKYNPKITYDGKEINQDCFDKISKQFGLTDNAAWFIDEIKTKNQDELHFTTYFCDKTKAIDFTSNEARKQYINGCIKGLNKNKDYSNFKLLLRWFINQLNINNDFIKGDHTSGKGYKGDSIRNKYLPWREYSLFTLDCTIQSGYNKASDGANYIHKDGVNVRPHFNGKTSQIEYVHIDIYNPNNEFVPGDIKSLCDKEFKIESLALFDNAEPNEFIKELFDSYSKVLAFYSSSLVTILGFNKIIYGTPGCGKSFFVENKLLSDGEYLENGIKKTGLNVSKENRIRTTFYPEYTNTDFVGQIIPKVIKGSNEFDKDEVTYAFNPGPFALALLKALSKPNESIALIIEELNRGNAAAIFGDVFQLLDREKETDLSKNIKKGWSQYGINNTNLLQFINEELTKTNPDFIPLTEIKIPNNLYIIATMNTSDQNVFTLDTAFKRRWSFLKLTNDFSEHDYKDYRVPGMSDYTWEEVVDSLNEYMIDKQDLMTSEDKQIGTYFIEKKDLIKDGESATDEQVQEFAYKLMEYLWDDVAKFDRSAWFDEDIRTLDELIKAYKEKGTGVFKNGNTIKHRNKTE